jgi:hypothetical protein
VVLAALVLGAVTIGWLHRRRFATLPGRGCLAVAVAVACFAVALGIDAVDVHLRYVVAEDLAKLLGIVNWSLGWTIAARAALEERQTPSASSNPTPHSRSRSVEE